MLHFPHSTHLAVLLPSPLLQIPHKSNFGVTGFSSTLSDFSLSAFIYSSIGSFRVLGVLGGGIGAEGIGAEGIGAKTTPNYTKSMVDGLFRMSRSGLNLVSTNRCSKSVTKVKNLTKVPQMFAL